MSRVPVYPIFHAKPVIIEGDFHCSYNELFRQNPNDNVVLLILGNFLCFPSEISEIALENGYSGVLLVHDSSFFNIGRINFWDRIGNGVPVYRTRVLDIDWNSLTEITLRSSSIPNIFNSKLFLAQMTIVSVFASVIAFCKIVRSVRVLRSYWKHNEFINHGILILVIEIIASIVIILYFFDPYGVRGIYPWALTSLLIRLFVGLSLLSTCVAWDGLIVARINAHLLQQNRKIFALRQFSKLALAIFIMVECFAIFRSFTGDVESFVVIIETFVNALLTVFFSYSFLRNKSAIFQVLTKTSSRKDAAKKKRKAYYLALSAIFMLLVILISVLISISTAITIPGILAWYFLAIFAFCQTLVGWSQVLSVPFNEN